MQKQIKSIVNTEYVSWLLYLPRGVEQLKELGELKKYPADCLLAAAGTHTRYCYVVVSGRVISSEYSESGEERIYSVNEKDSLLLEENLLFGYKVPVNIRTITESEVVRIDRHALTTAIQEKLSQEYISSLLGLNRITVVRVMKELKEQGLVEKKKGYYHLHDMDQMQENRDEKWA